MFNSYVKNETPATHYLKAVIKNQHLVLPLLDKVRGKTLCLQSYALSKAHCLALAEATKVFDIAKINRIWLENCGVDDEEFAQIIQACSHLTDFKSLVYVQNQVGELSMKEIPKLLDRAFPFHL